MINLSKPSTKNSRQPHSTVDGSEILHQLIGSSLSRYSQGFSTIPGGCLRFLPTGTHSYLCDQIFHNHPSIHCGLSLPHRSRTRFPSTTTWRWTKSACNAHTWGVGGRSQTSCGGKMGFLVSFTATGWSLCFFLVLVSEFDVNYLFIDYLYYVIISKPLGSLFSR